MLKEKTKTRIKNHSWNKHSNESLFFKRIKDQSINAINDFVLLANNLEEEQLAEIFTAENLERLIQALMRPDLDSSTNRKKGYMNSESENTRIFFLGHMFLKWSLNITGSVSNNKWFQELYRQHELPLKTMLDSLYYERKSNVEMNLKKTR